MTKEEMLAQMERINEMLDKVDFVKARIEVEENMKKLENLLDN